MSKPKMCSIGSVQVILFILTTCLSFYCKLSSCHHGWSFSRNKLQHFSQQHGVMVSFEQPVYTNGRFADFEGWKDTNEKYGSSNITYIIRIELARSATLREKRIQKHFRRFWLPGVIWSERNVRHNNMYFGNLTISKARNSSQIDLWVEPKCFLRHNGVSRIHRVARAMKLQVQQLRWLAKINYLEMEGYGPREVVEIAKQLTTDVDGIACAWVHPGIETR